MTKHTKKLLSFTLIICMLTATISSTNFYGNEIMPRYNNVLNVSTDSYTSNDGYLSINYQYTGIQDVTTKAVITTYIEKKSLLFFWNRIDIGDENNEIIETINNYKYTFSHLISLPSTGTYRVNVTYKIYGTGGSVDTINYQKEVTY